MKDFFKLFGNLNRAHSAKVPLLVIAFVAVIGFSMAGCKDGNDDGKNNNGGGSGGLSGTWGGNIGGYPCTIVITSYGYTFSSSLGSDSGTYIMDGITARLISTAYDMEIGTAVLLDSNTVSVTLNWRSFAPGTYRLNRL